MQVCVLPAGFSITVAVKPAEQGLGRADTVCPQSCRNTAKSREALGEVQTVCWLGAVGSHLWRCFGPCIPRRG